MLEEAVNYCKDRGLLFYAVNQNHPDDKVATGPRKLMADMFIDDRNFGGVPDWGFIYNALKNNQSLCFSPAIFNSAPIVEPPKKRSFFNRL